MAGVAQRKLSREEAVLVHERIRRRDALWARRAELQAEIDGINRELVSLRYKRLAKTFDVSVRTIEAIAQGIHYKEILPPYTKKRPRT